MSAVSTSTGSLSFDELCAALSKLDWASRTEKKLKQPLFDGKPKRCVDVLRCPALSGTRKAERARNVRYLLSLEVGLIVLDDTSETFQPLLKTLIKEQQGGEISKKALARFQKGMLALDLDTDRFPTGPISDDSALTAVAMESVIALGLFLTGGHLLDPTSWLQCYLQFSKWPEKLPPLQPNRSHSSLSSLLLYGELPYQLGQLLAGQSVGRQLQQQGREVYAEELEEVTDTDGTPHHSLIEDLPLWIDSFNRARMISEGAGSKFLTGKTRKRWEEFLRQAASLTTSQGELALANGRAKLWSGSLVEALPQDSGKKSTSWIGPIRQTLGQGKPSKPAIQPAKKKRKHDLTSSIQSDWGRIASLRSNWHLGSDLLSVKYAHTALQFEARLLGSTLFHGAWETNLTLDGNPLPLEEEWNSVCWYSEEEGDYLELRNQTEEATIDRQIFLSRNDHVALIADSVTFAKEGSGELSWNIPISGGWKTKPVTQERGLRLKQKNHEIRCLPLSLAQDRMEPAPESLNVTADKLQFQQQGSDWMCAAIWLDWSPNRKGKVADWNRLTVTESRQTLSLQQSFASRIWIGDDQWLYLKNREGDYFPRAVLGMHTDSECVIGEINSMGLVDRLIEVESDEEDE